MFRGRQRNVSLGTGRGRKERGEEKEGRQRRKKESEEREGGRDREKKGGKEEKKERKIRSDRVSRERRLSGWLGEQAEGCPAYCVGWPPEAAALVPEQGALTPAQAAQSANSSCNSDQDSFSLVYIDTSIIRNSMKIAPGEIRRSIFQMVDGGWKNSGLLRKGNVKSRVQ